MIKTENYLGWVEISREFLVDLITATANACFGVAGMAFSDTKQGIKDKILKKNVPEKGVQVKYTKQNLTINLHILVVYGMNISAVSKSIINKVSYAVEYATGITVNSVNVFVDGIKV